MREGRSQCNTSIPLFSIYSGQTTDVCGQAGVDPVAGAVFRIVEFR